MNRSQRDKNNNFKSLLNNSFLAGYLWIKRQLLEKKIEQLPFNKRFIFATRPSKCGTEAYT